MKKLTTRSTINTINNTLDIETELNVEGNTAGESTFKVWKTKNDVKKYIGVISKQDLITACNKKIVARG